MFIVIYHRVIKALFDLTCLTYKYKYIIYNTLA